VVAYGESSAELSTCQLEAAAAAAGPGDCVKPASAPNMDDHHVHHFWGISPYINLLDVIESAGKPDMTEGDDAEGVCTLQVRYISMLPVCPANALKWLVL
jgi:hypothetical protein